MTPVQAEIEVRELMPCEMVLAIADYFTSLGQRVWQDAGTIGSDDLACATEYLQVCHEAAEGLRKVMARYDRRVQRHLEGPCKAH